MVNVSLRCQVLGTSRKIRGIIRSPWGILYGAATVRVNFSVFSRAGCKESKEAETSSGQEVWRIRNGCGTFSSFRGAEGRGPIQLEVEIEAGKFF